MFFYTRNHATQKILPLHGRAKNEQRRLERVQRRLRAWIAPRVFCVFIWFPGERSTVGSTCGRASYPRTRGGEERASVKAPHKYIYPLPPPPPWHIQYMWRVRERVSLIDHRLELRSSAARRRSCTADSRARDEQSLYYTLSAQGKKSLRAGRRTNTTLQRRSGRTIYVPASQPARQPRRLSSVGCQPSLFFASLLIIDHLITLHTHRGLYFPRRALLPLPSTLSLSFSARAYI